MMKLGTITAHLIVLAPLVALGFGRTEAAAKDGTGKAAAPDPADVVQKQARDLLIKFEKEGERPPDGTRNPRWKLRMECLVKLAKAGPAVVPVLVEAAKAGPAHTRGLAVQALGFLGDPRARPALVQAVDDPDRRVKLLAIEALARTGRLRATDKHRLIAEKDPAAGTQFDMAFALTRDDKPNPEVIRKTLAEYDLAQMNSARLGTAAPEIALADTVGKTYSLRQFRDQSAVVLVFLQHTE
jgi:HEAT repeat protein